MIAALRANPGRALMLGAVVLAFGGLVLFAALHGWR